MRLFSRLGDSTFYNDENGLRGQLSLESRSLADLKKREDAEVDELIDPRPSKVRAVHDIIKFRFPQTVLSVFKRFVW